MVEFSMSDATVTIDHETGLLISKLILSWARFDSLVTHWVIHSFGMPPGAGAILLGNMDTKMKLDRLKKLYAFYEVEAAVSFITGLLNQMRDHVGVRNAITHKACGGHWKPDPDRLVFASAMPFEKQIGSMQVELIHLDQLREAEAFASTAGDAVSDAVDRLLAQLEQQQAQSDEQTESSHLTPQGE